MKVRERIRNFVERKFKEYRPQRFWIKRFYDLFIILIIYYAIENEVITIKNIKFFIIIMIIYCIYNLIWDWILDDILIKIRARGTIDKLEKKYGKEKGKEMYRKLAYTSYEFAWERTQRLSKYENIIFYLTIFFNPFWVIIQIIEVFSIKIKIKLQKYLSYKLYEIIENYIFFFLYKYIWQPFLRIFFIYYHMLYKWRKYSFIEYFFMRLEGMIVIIIFLLLGVGWWKRILFLILFFIYFVPLIDKYIWKMRDNLVDPDTTKIFCQERGEVSFFLQLLRGINLASISGYPRSKYNARFEWNYYYLELNEIIKNGYYFFDYDIYNKLVSQFWQFEPYWFTLFRYKFNKNIKLIYFTREEFDEEFKKIMLDIKEKIFLIWDIAEYFDFYVEKDARKIITIYCRLEVPFIKLEFDYKRSKLFEKEEEMRSTISSEEELEEELKEEYRKFEQQIYLQNNLIIEQEKEKLKEKKKEIQRLFKKKGEKYIKQQVWYCKRILPILLKDKYIYEIGKIGAIIEQLNWQEKENIWKKLEEMEEKRLCLLQKGEDKWKEIEKEEIEFEEREIHKYVELGRRYFIKLIIIWRREWENKKKIK